MLRPRQVLLRRNGPSRSASRIDGMHAPSLLPRGGRIRTLAAALGRARSVLKVSITLARGPAAYPADEVEDDYVL